MKPLASRPSSRLLVIAGVWLVLSVGLELGALTPVLGTSGWRGSAVQGGWALLATLAFLDWRAIRSLTLPEPVRELPRSLSLHRWAPVSLRFDAVPVSMRGALLFEDLPSGGESEDLPIHLDATSEVPVRCTYRFRAAARGDARFGRPVIAAYSPLRLWRFTAPCGEADEVRVYPDFAGLGRFETNLVDAIDAQLGPRRRQRRGVGTEFHQLREYRIGDHQRQIDWKATSRRQNLITREFENERDQRVVFLLDCGRRMRAKDGQLSHFDHALNATVRLAHAALCAGDAVGMLSFGEEQRWLPVRKGVATVNHLLNMVYDLEPSTSASDFVVTAAELQRRITRRALVVVLTHLRDEDSDDLLAGVDSMRRRHLVLVANLRSPQLDRTQRQPVDSFEGALRKLGAWHYEIERRELASRLHERGVWSLDATPQDLAKHLVEHYHAIKRAGQL